MNTPRINPVAREIEDMDQIYFQVGSSELQDASYKQLYKIVKAMIENPEVNLKLTGHTDNSGNEGANKTLSLNRAKSIRNYIVANGVSQSRIKVEGAGSSKSLNNNLSEKDMEVNRRVEFECFFN